MTNNQRSTSRKINQQSISKAREIFILFNISNIQLLLLVLFFFPLCIRLSCKDLNEKRKREKKTNKTRLNDMKT